MSVQAHPPAVRAPLLPAGGQAPRDPAKGGQLEPLGAAWCHSLSVLTDRAQKASPCRLNGKHTAVFLPCSFLLAETTLFVTLKFTGSHQHANVAWQIPPLALTETSFY